MEPVPYVIDDQFRPRLVTGDRADGILDDVWRTSRGSVRPACLRVDHDRSGTRA